jgi:hypothetical protein
MTNIKTNIRQFPSGTMEQKFQFLADQMYSTIKNDRYPLIVKSKAKSLKGKTEYETVKNVYNYVADLIEYKRDDDDLQTVTAPSHLISGARKQAECKNMSILLVALLTELDIYSEIVAVRHPGSERADGIVTYTHVIVFAYPKDSDSKPKKIILDATMKSIGKTVKILDQRIYKNKIMPVAILNDNVGARCRSNCKCGGKRKQCGCNRNNGRGDVINNINIGNTKDSHNLQTFKSKSQSRSRRTPVAIANPNNPEVVLVNQPPKTMIRKENLKYRPRPKKQITIRKTADSIL